MSFWKKNIEALKKRDEDMFVSIQEYRTQMSGDEIDIFVEQARDGSDILGIVQDERRVRLNSTYRPREEAVKFAGKIQLTDNSITVLFGLGNGQIAAEIANKLNEEAQLLIYEPNAELYFFVMEHFDLTSLLADKRISMYVEGIDADKLSTSLSFLLTNINVGVTVLEAHPKYKDLFPEEYVKIKRIFKECRDSALTNLRTIISRSKLMTENAIANLPYFLHSKLSTDFVGKFPTDMPAIVVSGGPSLDKNYEVLKQAKGKALIIAMDRTAKYLLDRGIEPDIYCSLDYSKNPSLFKDERLRDIPFLYMPDLNHRVMKVVGKKNLIYGTGDFRFYDSLIREYGKEPISIPVGGSVATFAYGFAWAMGFRRIILVGQDLALTDGKVYSGGQVNIRKDTEEFEHMMIPGNVEEMVETRGDFYVYWIWFNQAVKEVAGKIEVINATEGGARIEGTKVITLQEAVDTYCTKEYNISDIFDKEGYIFPQENLEEVCKLLERKRKDIIMLKEKAKEAREAARRCSVLTERGDSGKEFKEKNKILSQTSKLFDENVMANLLNKYTENLMLEQDMDLFITEDDKKREMMRLYHKLEYDYNVIYDSADVVLEKYDEAFNEIKEELQAESGEV